MGTEDKINRASINITSLVLVKTLGSQEVCLPTGLCGVSLFT